MLPIGKFVFSSTNDFHMMFYFRRKVHWQFQIIVTHVGSKWRKMLTSRDVIIITYYLKWPEVCLLTVRTISFFWHFDNFWGWIHRPIILRNAKSMTLVWCVNQKSESEYSEDAMLHKYSVADRAFLVSIAEKRLCNG